MRQSRILVLVGLALVAAVGILAWSTRRTEPAPILVNPSAAYPASNFETSPPAELPAYATKRPSGESVGKYSTPGSDVIWDMVTSVGNP